MSREDAPSAPTVSYVVITTSWSASLQWWDRERRERGERERGRKMRRRRVREEDSPLRELCSLGTVINEDRESITMQSGVNLSGPLMDEGGRAHH